MKSAIASFATLFVLISCSASFKNDDDPAATPPTETVEEPSPGGFPVGAVVAFDAAACPTNWTVFSPVAGRTIIGAGTGNTDADGAALTTRTLGDFGGREFTTGIPASTLAADQPMAGPTMVIASTSHNVFRAGPANSTIDGVKADSNMPPFVARLYCKQTAEEHTIPDAASVAFTGASCGTGWQSDDLAKGRVTFGVGTGNNDADGTALTARALNDVGGKEFTSGIPAHTAPATDTIPAPGMVPAPATANGNTYGSDLPYNAISGTLTESNLPPYVVNKFCKRDGTNLTTIESGTVVAFDLAACPSGWSAYAAAKGRIILGEGSGNNDADGTALTARTLNATGGREYTTGMRVSEMDGLSDTPNFFDLFAAPVGTFLYRVTSANTTFAGVKEESNMPPFYVLLYCQKD